MLTLSLLYIFRIVIRLILLRICYRIIEKSFIDREKARVFECGFDPVKKARLPFSFRFFLITIVFLVFDVEVVVLMPLGLSWEALKIDRTILVIRVILFILIYGLFYEWSFGCLNWIY